MTPDEKNKLIEKLYNLPVSQLVQMIIDAQEEVQESKELKRRMLQIRNIVLDKEERRRPGRPSKGESDNLLFSTNKERATNLPK